MATEIIIVSGNTGTQRLQLSPAENIQVEKNKDVKWKIKDGSNVTSFRIVVKTDDGIFSEMPNPENEKKWKAHTKRNARNHDKCVYGIYWRAGGAQEYLHDPIITIKPSPGLFESVIQIVVAAALFILGLFTLKSLRRKS